MRRRNVLAVWLVAFGELILEGAAAAVVGRKVSARMRLSPAEDAWGQVAADLRAAVERHPLPNVGQVEMTWVDKGVVN